MTGNEVDKLKSPSVKKRLGAIAKIKKELPLKEKEKEESVNLQIHTSYSFSPYTPSMAAYMAYRFSLTVAGILDDYTVAGANEFIKACKTLGITYSVGMNLRCDFGRKKCNVSLLGIAERYFDKVEKATEGLRAKQKDNLFSSIDAINRRIKKYGMEISFEKDVKPLMKKSASKVFLSKYAFYATALKIIEKFGKGEVVADLVLAEGLELTQNEVGLLRDLTNPYYEYDLAKILLENDALLNAKKVYPSPEEVVAIGKRVGAVCCFEYDALRNRKELSAAEKIKYNADLVKQLKSLGFSAIAFDPTKFSELVLKQFLCEVKNAEMLALNLTKVEFPRRRFDCIRIGGEAEKTLIENAFVIVGSEMSENSKDSYGFTSETVNLSFQDRVKLFARIGRKGL